MRTPKYILAGWTWKILYFNHIYLNYLANKSSLGPETCYIIKDISSEMRDSTDLFYLLALVCLKMNIFILLLSKSEQVSHPVSLHGASQKWSCQALEWNKT